MTETKPTKLKKEYVFLAEDNDTAPGRILGAFKTAKAARVFMRGVNECETYNIIKIEIRNG